MILLMEQPSVKLSEELLHLEATVSTEQLHQPEFPYSSCTVSFACDLSPWVCGTG